MKTVTTERRNRRVNHQEKKCRMMMTMVTLAEIMTRMLMVKMRKRRKMSIMTMLLTAMRMLNSTGVEKEVGL